MDTNSDEQFLIIQATVEGNNQETDEKQINTDEKLTHITENLKVLTAFMMDQNKNSKFSPDQKYTPTPLEPTAVVPANRRAPPLDIVHSTKIGGMRTLNSRD